MPLIVDIKLEHPESQNINRLPVGFKVLNPRNVGEEREGVNDSLRSPPHDSLRSATKIHWLGSHHM